MDEACRHTDVNGLTGTLGQIGLATNTAQFSLSLGLEQTISFSADNACTKRLANSELERDGRPVSGAIHERPNNLH